MDGLLHFVVKGGNEKSKAQQALLVEGIESDTHCIFEKMRESVMPLGMWEIKSTCVSNGGRSQFREVFLDVL